MKYLMFVAVCLVPIALSADAKSDWTKSYKGRTGTLKIDLPTVVPTNVGVLVLTPDRGQYYRYGDFQDRSPEQLLTRVKAAQAAGKPIRVWGWETGQTEPAELVAVRAGSKVTIARIDLRDQELRIALWDEFANQKHTINHRPDFPSTSFQIQWPREFAKDFHDRQEIDALIATVLTW